METTVKTGADQAADTLTAKLRAAGWEVRLGRHVTEPEKFTDGIRNKTCGVVSVGLHADGPRSIGSPYLFAWWSTIIEPSYYHDSQSAGATDFSADIRHDNAKHELHSEAEMNAWLDALIAVAAALAA